MKKIHLTISILLLSRILFAQLEVNDTILMAFKNDVFWTSSSELEQDMYADFGKYGSTNLSDNDPMTCWAEGSNTDGSGEYICFTIPNNIETIRVRNGYQKNENIFSANNRIKTIKFILYACYEPAAYVTESHNGFFISEPIYSSTTVLEDISGFQDVSLKFNWPVIYSELSHDNTFEKDRFILKIAIEDIYKGNKWDDACISDIQIVPQPIYELTPDEHGLLKRTGENIDTLFYNSENVNQVVEVSPDLKWIIFILLPSDIDGRAETIYKLYNTKKEDFIDIKDVYEMYGFEEDGEKLYLIGTDNNLNDFKICLDDI